MMEYRSQKPAGQKLSRRLSVFLFCLVILFIFLGSPATSPGSGTDLELKVMTFNVRFDNPADGPHNWKYRRDAAADLIRSRRVDLVGTQEVLHNQLDDFLERLPEYGYLGVGREDGRSAGEFSAILFRKDRFQVLRSGNFWLSETPEVPGSKGWDAACERIVTWAIFKEKANNIRFAFFNTHFDHVGQEARKQSALLLLRRLKQMAGTLPVIVTGDFNATPESEPVRIILGDGCLVDSREVAQKVSGPAWSFHGFGRVPETERSLIDYVLVSHHFRVVEYLNISDRPDEVYYSDHNPVMVRLVIVRR
ncbi:MAG: endonuclease/exonuclease/phosphatase family protein [Candidatus Saccharicenans sp.]